jgi:hypothetical protein
MTPISAAVRDVTLLSTRGCLCCRTLVEADQAFCGAACRDEFAAALLGNALRHRVNPALKPPDGVCRKSSGASSNP